jgi:hypothetical protein
MYFFRLAKKTEEMRNFAWKVLDLVPDDEEAQNVLGKSYLSTVATWRYGDFDKMKAVQAIEPLWRRGKLNYKELVIYADILEDVKQYSESLEVALPLCDDERLDDKTQIQARSIAARSAMKLGKIEIAEELIETIPQEKLNGSLALVAIEICQKNGDMQGVFEIANKYCSITLVLVFSGKPFLLLVSLTVLRSWRKYYALLKSSMWLRRTLMFVKK